jgi:hypothetical protein
MEGLEQCLTTAKAAGVPADQAERFLSSGYVPYPWQWQFHAAAREADKPNGPTRIAAGGARGPGKSHCIFSQITLDDLSRFPNLKALFLRQTGKAAKESLEDLVFRVLAGKVEYEFKGGVLRFPNGSRAILGGFKDEKDIDKYIGIEYDIIGVEEGNQLSGVRKEMLRGSLRTSKPGWRPRWYESFNPGGIGHGDVKSTYVEPYRSQTERDTRFIPSTYRDNPNLNVEYITYLENLTGQLGRAWREGDFDILAGQFFTEWRYDLHVKEPYAIPDEWNRYCELDYGYNAPSALFWNAITPEGKVVTYRELYRSGLTYSQLAEEFVAMTPAREKIDFMVADPSIWNKDGRNDNALSGAEIFERRVAELWKGRDRQKSIALVRGNNDRIAGWAVFREFLRPQPAKDPYTGRDIVTSKFEVFSTCTELVRTMPLQVHDPNNPEDLDTEQEDHAQDAKRYGFMERPRPSMTPDQISKREFDLAMKRKAQLQGKRKRIS